MIRADTKEKYTYGGLVYMASMMETIRKQYGKINTVWLDGGDQFQGGI
jgi:2',3'-cyclic-nucleotide 2'-phosphodiesterase (5'-nucleotidase family)